MTNPTAKPFTNATVAQPPGGPALQNLPNEVKQAAATLVEASLDSIVAAPLNPPDFVNLAPVNPNVSFRWVLHTLYKRDGTQNMLRFEEAKQQGFAVAKKEDVKNPPNAYLQSDGSFRNGDLILCKMERKKYEGAKLFKDQQAAKQILAASGAAQQQKVNKEIGYQVGGKAKIQAFSPTEQELASFVGQDFEAESL